jgi:hypothetical protein
VTEAVSWLTASISNGVVTISAVSNNTASPRYGKVRVNNATDILVTQFGTSSPVAVASRDGAARIVPNPGNPTPFRVANHLSPLLISISPLTIPLNATADIIAVASDGYFANDVVPPGSSFPVSNYPAVLTVDGSAQTFNATLTERNELRWLNVPIGALQSTATGGTLRLRFPRLRATGTRIAFDLETTAPFVLSNADVPITAAVLQNNGITFTKGQPIFFNDPIKGQGYSIAVTVAETVATAFAASQGNVPGTRFNVIGNLQGFGYTTYARVQSTPGNARLISANNRGGGGSNVTATDTFGGVGYAENDDSITYEIQSANDAALESFTFHILVQGGDAQDAQFVRDALNFPLSPLLLFGVDPCGTIPLNSKLPAQRSACGSQAGELQVEITNVAIVGNNRRITYTVTNTQGDDGPSTPVIVRGNAGLGYSFASCSRSDGGACTVSGDTHQANISDLVPGTTTTFTVDIAAATTVPDGTLVESVFLAESGIDEEQDRSNNQVSDTFVKQACAPLTPASATFNAPGGGGTVNVPNCYIWTATTNANWITITSPTPGVETFDPGVVTYTVAPYTGSVQRTGTIVIAGNNYTITQRVPCSLTVGPPSSSNVGNTASNRTFALTTGGTNCAWTATDNAAWITTVTPASSTNSQIVTVNFEANNTLAQRTGVVTFRETGLVGGPSATATIVQAAGVPCSLSVSSPNTNVAAGGGTGTINVTATGVGCSWSLSENATWLSLSSTSGAASAAVTYTATANTGAARSVTVNLMQTGVTNPIGSVTLNQAAAPPCTLGMTSTNTSIPLAGGTGTLNISATGSGCNWVLSENATWLTLSSTAGTTSTPVTFTAAANSGAARSVTVNLLPSANASPVASITLNQAGTGQCISVSAFANPVPVGGRSGTLTLTASTPSCAWTATSNRPWLQVGTASGTGSRTLSYRVYPNFGSQTRTGTITIGGVAVNVTQSASTEPVARRFIRLLYFSYFGRAASDEEVSAWIATGASRRVLAASFLRSQEFNLAGRFVAGLYVGILNRDPEFSGWIFQRDEISTGAGQQCVFANNFVNSAEFALRNPNLTNEGFIRLLYLQVLGREPSPSEIGTQLPALQAIGRGQLACNFLNTDEFRLGKDARLTAFLLYATLLLRDSSEQERTNLRNVLTTNPSALEPLLDLFTNSSEINLLLQ